MTSLPINQRPTISATPKVSITAEGTAACASEEISLVRITSIIAANGPTALAISLEPWLKANADAVKTCIQLNIIKVALVRSSLCLPRILLV